MKVVMLIGIFLVAVYVANVICCMIFCEAYENTQIAKPLVLAMPMMIIELFFYFAFAHRDSEYGRMQGLISYLMVPAKDLFIVQCCADACKQRNRENIFEEKQRANTIPKAPVLADWFKTRMDTAYATR